MLENVQMPAIINGNFTTQKALEILSHLGIKELAHKMPQELSGGEKQRAAIARALRNNPALILADEPTGNLDTDNADIIYRDLKTLSKSGVCILMATHNPRACDYADRIWHLENKKLKTKNKSKSVL
jgi:ABC-type lipoprotein export system ATPase subunit